METVVYLIRHSVRFNNKNLIEKYNTNQNELIKYEKIILSVTGEKRAEIGKILRELCNWKKVNIINAEVCPDHVHMLVEIPPKYSVSSFMGFLKGKSSIMIYEKWGNMKYKYRNREFWCRGYYVDTVGKNTKAIDAYISNQLKEDSLNGQLTFEDVEPFKK